MKWIWKAYYKMKFGKDYAARISRAATLMNYTDEASIGNLSQFYNYQGEQIRGWHKRRPSHASSTKHPLETYYSNKG
jgi:hypothetical protein